MDRRPLRPPCPAPVSGERNKSLGDFSDALAWLAESGHDVVVIGGMAVGIYAPTVGATVLSADLDLLATPEQQRQISTTAIQLQGVRVKKRPQPRTLPVLVLDWRGLEIDVLTESAGLPSPQEARARAWNFDGTYVLDPVDLLANKLAVNREKDQPHLPVLREVCEAAALHAFASQSDRTAIGLLGRWVAVEGWERLPQELFSELLRLAERTSAAGRRFLVSWCLDQADGKKVVAVAPPDERDTLRAVLGGRVE